MKSVQVVDFLMLVILGLAVAVVLLYLTGCDAEEEEEPYFDTDIFWENEKDTGTGPMPCDSWLIDKDKYTSCWCRPKNPPCGGPNTSPIFGIEECENQGMRCCCEGSAW